MTLPKEYVEYVETLPRNGRGIHWTIESFAIAVPLRYPGISLANDQVWVGRKSKYRFICSDHGYFETRAANFLNDNAGQGSGCKLCIISTTKSRKDLITEELVGQTTADGHVILEHVGYRQSPSQEKRGCIGHAIYRYRCAQCGNESAIAYGQHLKRIDRSTHCGCQESKRESINTHLNNKKKAESPCHVYIAPVWDASFTKIGISKDFEKRSRMHEVQYETPYFLSPELPRAWCYTAEQILLRETMNELPITPLPKEMVEVYWPGTSELRDGSIDPSMLVARFWEIIKDIESDGDWYRVYQSSFAVRVGTH